MALALSNPARSSPSSGILASDRDGRFPPHAASSDTEILILDDHPAILEAVTTAVEREEGLQVADAVGTAEEAREGIKTRSPDVFIVDLSLPDADGLALIEGVLDERPDTKVLVYSMFEERRYAGRALRAGARGYVNKSASTKRLIKAIRRILRGEISLSPDVTSRILGDVIRNRKYGADPSEQLTERERTVFRMMGRGRSVRDIAGQLDLSRKTVETYRRRAKEKLGYETVDDLLRFAIEWCGKQIKQK